jgi:hypothetical protein
MGDDGYIDMAMTKLVPDLFSGIIVDHDMAVLAFVMLSSCGGL